MTVYTPTAVVQYTDTFPTLVSSGVSAAAVASGTTIQTVVVASAGNYKVTAMSQPSPVSTGTIAATDAGNVLLKKNGTTLATVPQAGNSSAPLPLVLNMTLASGDSLTLVTGASAAPANVTYASTLLVQQVA